MRHRLLSTSILILLLLISVHPFLLGQDDLYMPLNIKKAYENGTRNYDGTAGTNYWQNSSDYKIKVEIDPQKKCFMDQKLLHIIITAPIH